MTPQHDETVIVGTQHRVFHGDCIEVLSKLNERFDCIFTDVPDNIGREYNEYEDNLATKDYLDLIERCLYRFTNLAPVVWVSFNSKWTLEFATLISQVLADRPDLRFKPCVQTFTFGVQQQRDLKNCHRPLWRLMRKDAHCIPTRPVKRRGGYSTATSGLIPAAACQVTGTTPCSMCLA